jgi:hypothetical protein
MRTDALEDFVIKRASTAYAIAKLRAHKGRSKEDRSDVLEGKSLADAFPHHYTELPNSKHVVFDATKTADAIVEEYLEGIGYFRGSKEWMRLIRIVMDRGERLYQDYEP